MRTTLQAIIAIALGVLLAVLTPTPATAQADHGVAGPPARRVFALVAMPDDFRYGGTDAVISRRANELPHDVIILRKGKATPALLSEAVVTLQAVRARHGNTPSVDQLIRVRTPGANPRDAKYARRWTEHLVASKEKNVPGVGRAAAVGLLLRTDEVTVQRKR